MFNLKLGNRRHHYIARFGLTSLSIFWLAIAHASASAAEPVDCTYPSYSRISDETVLHGNALVRVTPHGELLVALDEDGFADIKSGTGVTDKIIRLALSKPSAAEQVVDFWGQERPREVRLTKRSAVGYSEVELYLLEGPAIRWAFTLDAYGCSEKVSEGSRALPENQFELKALSIVRVSGKRLSLKNGLREFDDSPLVPGPSSSDGSRAFCGHGGENSLSCSIDLPFGFGCSAECLPGSFACCNTFGGCTCMPGDPAGGGGISPPGGGSGGGGSTGGGDDADIVCSYDESGDPIPGNPPECPESLPKDEIRP